MSKLMFVTGVALALIFVALDLAGFGAYTTVLSGMVTGPNEALGGLSYVVAWFGFVVAAPIFVIGASVHRFLFGGPRTPSRAE